MYDNIFDEFEYALESSMASLGIDLGNDTAELMDEAFESASYYDPIEAEIAAMEAELFGDDIDGEGAFESDFEAAMAAIEGAMSSDEDYFDDDDDIDFTLDGEDY